MDSTKRLLVYRASAGSGKTYSLVLVYLRLALANPDPSKVRQLLAVTFTHKATQEMKSRILGQLKFMAGLGNPQNGNTGQAGMQEELVNTLGIDHAELKRRAGNLLQHILHRYSDLSIGTIDAFVTQMARPFYRELRTSQEFEIELDQHALLDEAITDLLGQLGKDADLTKILHLFSRHLNEQDQHWHIRKSLLKFASKLFEDRTYPHLGSLVGYSTEWYQQYFDGLETERQVKVHALQQSALDLSALLGQAGFVEDDFVMKSQGILGYLNKLGHHEEAKLNRKTREGLQEGRILHPSCRKMLSPQLAGRLTAWAQEQENAAEEISMLDAFLDLRYATTLLGKLYSHLLAYSQESVRMPLNFLYFQLADLVRHTHADYLADRVGQRYLHVLVDEFQDTSLLQWRCLFPLIENSLASGGTTLVVGDIKQSIYRWRNGDARLLANLPGNLHGEAISPLFEASFEGRPLRTNRRSTNNIVAFNNAFYGWCRENYPDSLGGYYQEVHQDLPDAQDIRPPWQGATRIITVQNPNKERLLPLHRAAICLEIVRELRQKHLKPHQIALLVRTNKAGNRLALDLIRSGQPVLSPDSLVLTQNPAVQLVMQCWTYLHFPDDALNAESLVRILETSGREVVPTKSPSLLLATKFPQLNLSVLALSPLASQLHRLVDGLFGRNHKDPYLQRLLDEWITQCARGSQVADMVAWWEQEAPKIKLQIQDAGDAVQLLTVHSAKGLEFPAVVLAEPDRGKKLPVISHQWLNKNAFTQTGDPDGTDSTRDQAHTDRPVHLVSHGKLRKGSPAMQSLVQEEDRLNELDYFNMLYVATTRPRNHLFVLSEDLVKPPSFPTFGGLFQDFVASGYPDKAGWVRSDEQLGGVACSVWKMMPEALRLDAASEDTEALKSTQDQATETAKGTPQADSPTQATSPPLQLSWNPTQNFEAEAGTAFHDLASLWDHPLSVTTSLEAFALKEKSRPALRDRVLQWAHSALNRPDLQDYYSGQYTVLREHILLDRDGSLLKPDMILLRDDKTAEIRDYKTGQPQTEHKEQVQRYVDLLRSSGWNASGDLIYLDSDNTLPTI